MLCQLGDGSYGSVWKAINKQTNEMVGQCLLILVLLKIAYRLAQSRQSCEGLESCYAFAALHVADFQDHTPTQSSYMSGSCKAHEAKVPIMGRLHGSS